MVDEVKETMLSRHNWAQSQELTDWDSIVKILANLRETKSQHNGGMVGTKSFAMMMSYYLLRGSERELVFF